MPEAAPMVVDTAIIPVHGILGKHLGSMAMMSGGCDVDRVSADIDVAVANANVRQIIFDFCTPGGSVVGIPELGRKIAGISKQTKAFADDECCSGGMWLASQCQHFYGTESATYGSIGVWCAYWDLTKMLEMEGSKMQSIQAGKYKLMGAYWKPLTDEEEAMLQADVDKTHAQFKDAINLRREVPDEFMQGQCFDGPEAVEAGLLDGLVESIEELL
jgi:signal peptide peptidase SppA